MRTGTPPALGRDGADRPRSTTPDPTEQLSLLGKRWNRGVERFVPPAYVVDTRNLRVDVIKERHARDFVVEHHYSKSFPAAKMSLGVYENRELAGVIVFSIPMNQKTIPHFLDVAPSEGVELGRLILADRLGFNAESFVIARALRLLKSAHPQIRRVISFADPMERRDTRTGQLTKAAHRGVIYKASNASFQGRSTARWLHIAPNGDVLSPRAVSKVRNDERGRDYAERALVAAGVDARRPFESGAKWLSRVMPNLERVWHPGNFAYRFDLRP